MKLEDSFENHYGKFERYRSEQPMEFEDFIMDALKRGSKKSRRKKSKNLVKWTPQPGRPPHTLSMGTWGEVHALFDKSGAELASNTLHQFLLKAAGQTGS